MPTAAAAASHRAESLPEPPTALSPLSQRTGDHDTASATTGSATGREEETGRSYELVGAAGQPRWALGKLVPRRRVHYSAHVVAG